MAHRKGWSSSQRIKRYCRNRARQQFNIAWRKEHPIERGKYSDTISRQTPIHESHSSSTNTASYASKSSTNSKTIIISLIVVLLIGIVVYSLLPKCYICGNRTFVVERICNKTYYLCSEHASTVSEKNKPHDTATETTETPKSEEKPVETDAPFHAERPYYGMSTRYIDSTDIGVHKYETKTAFGPNGGMDYAFIIDSNHAMLVKTQDGKVTTVQYIENGNKVLWSETSSGYHDWK